MKAKITKFGPYVLLGLTFLMLLFLNLFYQDHWLDSDMAAEMMFARILAEEGHIFATPDWYYSTEFRFLYTHLIMGPLFHFMDNWHVIRTITNIVFYLLLLVSYFYFMKPLKVSGGLTALIACMLLWPFSETMMTHMQMGNTYMSHVIIIFFFCGMFLRLTGVNKYKPGMKFVLLACYVILGIICGVSGVRYLLALQCPLLLTALVYLLKTEAFQSFRKNMSRENWKELSKCYAAPYFYYSLLGAACSVVGYGINVLWVSKEYVFQTYGATNFISIYQGVLFERLQNAIGSLLMLFGYIPDKGFLSLRGVISMIAFVLLAVIVYATVKGMKNCTGMRYFVVLFLNIAFWLNVFVFVFTTSTMVPRYYITIFIFALPTLAFYLEEEQKQFDRLAVVVLLGVCLGMSTGKTVLSFMTADKNEDKRAVAAFLAEKDYNFGFATFTNGNIITELTNGEVEIGNIGDPKYLEYFKWSSPTKYYEEDYHQGETFLLLTVGEAYEYAEAEAVQLGECVYDDGRYVVLIYENVNELMSYAAVR